MFIIPVDEVRYGALGLPTRKLVNKEFKTIEEAEAYALQLKFPVKIYQRVAITKTSIRLDTVEELGFALKKSNKA